MIERSKKNIQKITNVWKACISKWNNLEQHHRFFFFISVFTLIAGGLYFFGTPTRAANETLYFRAGSGSNWSNTANWTLNSDCTSSGGHAVPTNTDAVIFAACSPSVTLDASTAKVAKSIDFTNYTGTATFNVGLTVSGNVTLGAGMTFAGSSSLTVSTTSTITSNGKTLGVPLLFSNSAPTITLSGNLTTSSNVTTNNPSIAMVLNGSNLIIGGNLTVSGSVSGTAGIILNGTGTWSGIGALSNNLTINTSGTITVSGTVSYNTGLFTYTSGTIVGASTPALVSSTGTAPTGQSDLLTRIPWVDITLTSGPAWTIPTGLTFRNFTINNTNTTITLSGTTTLTGNANFANTSLVPTLNGGTLNVAGNLSNSSTLNGSATIVMNGTGTWSGSGALKPNLTINTSGTITVSGTVGYSTGTFDYVAGTIVGASTPTLSSTSTPPGGQSELLTVIPWTDITLGNTGGTWSIPAGLTFRNISLSSVNTTITLLGDLIATGNGTLGNNGAMTLNGNSFYVAGNLTCNGTGTSGTTTVVMNGTGTWSSSATGTLNNNLTIDTSGTITVSGTIRYGVGTFSYVSGTILGASTPILDSLGGAPGGQSDLLTMIPWIDISLRNTAGAAWTIPSGLSFRNFTTTTTINLTLSGDLIVTGNLTMSMANGATTTINGNNMYVAGNLTLTGSSSSTGIITGTTTIILNGTGTWSQSSTSSGVGGFKSNLTIDTSGTITISGTVSYRAGTFTYNAGTIAGANTPNISYIAAATTTLNAPFVFPGTMTWVGNQTFNGTSGFTINTLTSTSAGSTFTLGAGNTYTVNNALTMTGTSPSHIVFQSDSTGNFTYFNLGNSATQNVQYVNATDIDSSGGQAISDSSGILTNTINWGLSLLYFVNGGVNNNWSSSSNWSTSSGGAGGHAPPDNTDTAVFDVNSPNVTIDSPAVAQVVIFSSYGARTATFNSTLTVSGNVTLGSTMSFAGSSALILNNTSTITSNGKTLGVPLTLQGTSLTYTLNGNLTVSGLVTASGTSSQSINSGTLIASGGFDQNTSATLGGTTVIQLAGGIWSNTGGGVFNNTLTLAGNITVSGTVKKSSGTMTYSSGTITTTGSTLNITASMSINTSGVIWNDVSVSSGTLTNNSTTSSGLNISGDLTGAGALTQGSNSILTLGGLSSITTFTASGTGNTVVYASTGADQTVRNVTYYNLTINKSGYTANLSGTTTINGSLNISAGTLDVTGSNYSLVVKGTWTNNGTFNAQSGTVTFSGTGAQTINSANTWYGLAITGGSRTVSFQSSVAQTISAGGSLTLNGTAGNVLTLAPLTAATSWQLNVGAGVTQSILYVSVSYSDASGGVQIAGDLTCVDGGHNVNWSFGAAGFSISGTTNVGNGSVIRVAINNTIDSNQATVSGGVWTITSVTATSGDIVTVFINGVADGYESTGVTKYNGTGDITGMVLNSSTLSIGSSQNNTITISNLSSYTSSNDEDVMHSVSGGSFLVQAVNNTYINPILSILSGNTLTVGNTEAVTTGRINIAGTLTSVGNASYTLNSGSGTLFTRTGTFTQGTSTVTLSGNGDATINSGAITFYNLTSSGTGVKSVHASNAITFDSGGTLTVSGGTFDPVTALVGSGSNILTVGSGTIRVRGSTFTGSYPSQFSTVNLNTGSTVDYYLNGTQTISSALSPYYNLTISSGGTKTLGGATVVGNVLTISAGTLDTSVSNYALSTSDISISGTLLGRGSLITVGENWINNGTFTAGTSEVKLNTGSTALVSGATDFYDLTITHTGAKEVNFSTSDIVSVSRYFVVNGHYNGRIKLYSTSAGTKWHFYPTGTSTVQYADVKDGGCEVGATTVKPFTSLNSGNNESCWNFFLLKPFTYKVTSANTVEVYDAGAGGTGHGDMENPYLAKTIQLPGDYTEVQPIAITIDSRWGKLYVTTTDPAGEVAIIDITDDDVANWVYDSSINLSISGNTNVTANDLFVDPTGTVVVLESTSSSGGIYMQDTSLNSSEYVHSIGDSSDIVFGRYMFSGMYNSQATSGYIYVYNNHGFGNHLYVYPYYSDGDTLRVDEVPYGFSGYDNPMRLSVHNIVAGSLYLSLAAAPNTVYFFRAHAGSPELPYTGVSWTTSGSVQVGSGPNGVTILDLITRRIGGSDYMFIAGGDGLLYKISNFASPSISNNNTVTNGLKKLTYDSISGKVFGVSNVASGIYPFNP